MSLKKRIKDSEHTDWPAEGIPKWRARLIIWWAKIKARIEVRKHG